MNFTPGQSTLNLHALLARSERGVRKVWNPSLSIPVRECHFIYAEVAGIRGAIRDRDGFARQGQ